MSNHNEIVEQLKFHKFTVVEESSNKIVALYKNFRFEINNCCQYTCYEEDEFIFEIVENDIENFFLFLEVFGEQNISPHSFEKEPGINICKIFMKYNHEDLDFLSYNKYSKREEKNFSQVLTLESDFQISINHEEDYIFLYDDEGQCILSQEFESELHLNQIIGQIVIILNDNEKMNKTFQSLKDNFSHLTSYMSIVN